MNVFNLKALRIASLFLLIFMFTTTPVMAEFPSFGDDSDTLMLRGRIVSVEDLEPDESVSDFVELEQLAVVEILRGPHRGEQYTLLNTLMGSPGYDIYLTEGRQILLWGEVDGSGTIREIYLQDFVRDTYLYVIGFLFIAALLIVGRFKGLLTILTLVFTITAIWQILLPLLLRGYPPIPVTLMVAALITIVTLVGIGGLQRKTAAAAIGTVGGLFVAGILAFWAVNAAQLTGFSSDEAQMLTYMEWGPIDVRGLLFSGIIIGALGAVMDVAMSIAAASHEVYCANPAICVRDQIKSALNVGRDVMGTMANTLILAYVGTTIPLLLLFMGNANHASTVINSDLVATEVVRALSGSIGLIAAIPLTAVAAGVLTVRTMKSSVKSLD
jgi:uncharacterized membrane protein